MTHSRAFYGIISIFVLAFFIPGNVSAQSLVTLSDANTIMVDTKTNLEAEISGLDVSLATFSDTRSELAGKHAFAERMIYMLSQQTLNTSDDTKEALVGLLSGLEGVTISSASYAYAAQVLTKERAVEANIFLLDLLSI